ncbi:phospholipase D-like domain-containing protein [Mesosutterella sp. OilRF-GAM-744-9]|uniref:Phospholipase D-like domain-containing protein n=1 Tax=Mesosutterella porci TaxID=2915351 RepID=A0ABS9MMT7_9BURK|nr:phospholipase D-like domain-containing protein [Mesosutterella sp. oilRF-744-WT-GAM-9]MCG5029939.1 phospholipase D-like domain-containing protein [Mesosutterella sp. oilRF-744-WT-GAM-9]
MNRIFVEDIARELHEAAERARTIVLVSPYVKKSALAALLDPAAPFSRLTLVARALIGDFANGFSDLEALSYAAGLGGRVLTHPSLHAKYYRFDDTVYIGSANLTANGTGLGLHGNLEMLARMGRSDETERAERLILRASEPLSAEDWRFLRRKTEDASRAADYRARVSGFLEEGVTRLPTRWLPLCTRPDLLFEIIEGQPLGRYLSPQENERRIVIEAEEDLRALAPPESALASRLGFNAWAGACLSQSEIARTIDRLFEHSGSPEPVLAFGFIKSVLEQDFGCREAYFRVQSLTRWLTYFLHSTYFIPDTGALLLARR